jgi:hypothetical protein
MGKKMRQADFDQAVEALKASGFEASRYAGVEGGVLVTRDGLAAVLAPGEEGVQVAVGAGKLVAGELARLEDRGYQKFLRTSRYELPATACDLHAIHLFSEELMQLVGAASLFNQSLGTTSDRYVYDRVQGRTAAVAAGVCPWETAGSH